MINIKKILINIKDYIKDNLGSIIFFGIFLFLILFNTSYQIYIPGGTVNLSDRIYVEDGYESKGSINSSYVSAINGKLLFVGLSYLIPDWDLVKISDITLDNETIDEAFDRDRILLYQANTIAQMVALDRANISYETETQNIKVLYNFKDNRNNLKVDDEIIAIDGVSVVDASDIYDTISNKHIDDTVKLTIIRDNKTMEIDSGFMEYNNSVVLGIYLTTNYEIKTAKKITIKAKNDETGSSGGFMTALALYDELTEGDLTNGKMIVGTGTIDVEGNVGEIGGVKYKLMGANKNKADIFLCPQANYEEAIKVKEEKKYDIEIYGISNIDEAIGLLNNL